MHKWSIHTCIWCISRSGPTESLSENNPQCGGLSMAIIMVLEIPVVLENVADGFLVLGQDRQQVHHEHGVPNPLAIEGVGRARLRSLWPGSSTRPFLICPAVSRLIVSSAPPPSVPLGCAQSVSWGRKGFPEMAGRVGRCWRCSWSGAAPRRQRPTMARYAAAGLWVRSGRQL